MIFVQIVETGATPGILSREMQRIRRLTFHEMGTVWHATMRPKHFTHAGAREYGYEPRKGQPGSGSPVKGERGYYGTYTGRKELKKRHTLPLVYSGQSRILASIGTVVSTFKGCRVKMPTRALNFRPHGGRINLRDEMTRISEREAAVLMKIANKNLKGLVTNLRQYKKVTNLRQTA